MYKIQSKYKKNNKELLHKFSIALYSTEKELEIYSNEVVPNCSGEKKENQRLQSKYLRRGGSKAGNTELRIAGVILNMVKAMLIRESRGMAQCRIKLTKKDIARQLQDEGGKGVSEVTIQRYLNNIVLPKLSKIYNLDFLIINGRGGGIHVWVKDLEQVKTKRCFDPTLVDKCRRKGDLNKYLEIKKQRGSKQSTFNYLAKGVNLNKRIINPSMMSLATNVLAQLEAGRFDKVTMPAFSRLDLSYKVKRYLLAYMLTKNAPIKSAVSCLINSMKIADTMMSDTHISNPAGYTKGIINKHLGEFKRKDTINASKKVQSEYWSKQLNTIKEEEFNYDDTQSRLMMSKLIKTYEEKLNSLVC